MSPRRSAEIPTKTAPTRVGGSIPSRATSSQEEDSPGKPGKTWEVGAPYIIDQCDAPDWRRIVVCTHADGRCRYLSIHNNRRWPHVMQLGKHSTPLAAFGVALWNSIGTIDGEQIHECIATYLSDGKPRRWQANKTYSMPLMASEPKYWRLDPQVAPKLIKWISANLPSVQWAKAMPEPPLTATSLQILHKPEEPPAWFASRMATAMAEDALAAHDAAWRTQFIRPLAAFMMQRDVAHLRLDLVEDKVQFALIAKGESVEVFELVDATDEERYYPLGLFFGLEGAIREAVAHPPTRWDNMHDDHAVAEIRARKIGMIGGDYLVLWRGEWHHDYEGHEWKLVEQQTGTLEKPLPLTRP